MKKKCVTFLLNLILFNLPKSIKRIYTLKVAKRKFSLFISLSLTHFHNVKLLWDFTHHMWWMWMCGTLCRILCLIWCHHKIKVIWYYMIGYVYNNPLRAVADSCDFFIFHFFGFILLEINTFEIYPVIQIIWWLTTFPKKTTLTPNSTNWKIASFNFIWCVFVFWRMEWFVGIIVYVSVCMNH